MPRHRLFQTLLYETTLGPEFGPRQTSALAREALALARDDAAGRLWSAANFPGGYTSYASLNDLPSRSPVFAALAEAIGGRIGAFCRAAGMQVRASALRLDSLWVNVLHAGGGHSGHIHPLSVVSGTYFAAMPKGAGGLRFEDPRLSLMMAAPPRRPAAPRAQQSFVTIPARAGTLLMWESWLRHEVPPHRGTRPRISVSFNIGWA